MADNWQLKAIISANAEGMIKALKNINAMSKTTRKYLLDISKSAGNLSGKLGFAGVLGFSAITYGATRAARSAMEYAGAIQDSSERTGASVEGFQSLANLLKQVGGTAEDAETAFKKFGVGIVAAAQGKNQSFAALLGRLGIGLKDSTGKVRSLEDVLPDLAAGFQRQTNPTLKLAMATELFGKSGTKLIPVLNQGREAMAAWGREQQRLGAIVSTQAIAAVDNLGDSFGVLQTQVKSQLTESLAKLVPILEPLIKQMSEWVAQNKELIQTKVVEMVREFSDWIQTIDFKKLIEDTKDVVKSVGKLIDSLGGAKNALIALVLFMNLQTILAFLGFIKSILRACWALGVFTFTNVPAAVLALKGLGKEMGTAGSKANNLMGKLGKLGALAGAGWLGWEVGSWANENIINPSIQALTGNKDATLGTWIADKTLADPMAAMASQPKARPSLIGPTNQVKASGQIEVSFKNAPPGLRVDTLLGNNSDIPFVTDVGYRSFATGGAY